MFDSPLSASPYEVLQVTPDVDEESLRRAYRLRLRQTHPDTGGDAATFIHVQRAWELVGTPEARAAYDRGHGFGGSAAPEFSAYAPPAKQDTRPGPRTSGQPGGRNREHWLDGVREWVGLGEPIADPYDPALVRSAPRQLRALLADALAEEETARQLADLGMGYTIWHDVAAPHRGDPSAKIDHVVLGPSGLFSLTSMDADGAVRVRRGELIGSAGIGTPVIDLVAATRAIAREAGVRFGGGIVVLGDDDLPEPVLAIGKVRGLIMTATGHSTLTTLLRRGVPGVGDIGGNEIFDVRTRLNRVIRYA